MKNDKKNDFDDFDDKSFILTTKQILELEEKVKEKGGTEKFLVSVGAIKVRDGKWTIIQWDDCVGKEAIFGLKYWNDIPYTWWSEALGQMDRYISRRDFAIKQQAKEYEQSIKQS